MKTNNTANLSSLVLASILAFSATAFADRPSRPDLGLSVQTKFERNPSSLAEDLDTEKKPQALQKLQQNGLVSEERYGSPSLQKTLLNPYFRTIRTGWTY